MKKILNVLLIFTVFLNVYSQQNGGAWFKHYLEGTVSDIQFIDDQIGFMTSNIYNSTTNKNGFLLKTIDGGHTWDAVPGELEDISNIAVVNENIIWVGTMDKGVYKTIDGGLTWHNYNPSTNALFTIGYDILETSYVYFFDENNGYIHYRERCNIFVKNNRWRGYLGSNNTRFR